MTEHKKVFLLQKEPLVCNLTLKYKQSQLFVYVSVFYVFLYMFLYLPFHYTEEKKKEKNFNHSAAEILSKLLKISFRYASLTLCVKTLLYKHNTVCVLTEY